MSDSNKGETMPINVLHVDDDPSVLDLTKSFLITEIDNISIATATDSNEAFDQLAEETFHCIISDYQMPGRDGLDLLAEMRNQYPNLPFILYTGKGTEEIAAEAINAGATGYLQKGGPDQIRRLANRVNHAAEEYRTQLECERFSTVLQALDYPVYVVNENAEFEYVNNAFVELTGCSREEIIGSPPGHIKSEEAVKTANEMLAEIVSSSGPERQKFRIDIQKADGDVVPCYDHMAALPFDDEFRGSVGILRDATTEIQQREELLRQNDLFKKAQKLANVGVWEYDIQEDEVTWTDHVYKIHDCPPDFTPSKENIIAMYHPDDQEAIREVLQDAVETGESYDLELRVQTADNGTRWVRTRGVPQTEDGEVVRLRGAIQDITENKQRIKEVLKLKRQYQTLADNIPNGAVFLFNDDLQYVRARGTELEAVGLSPDEIEGATPHDVFPEKLADELTHYFTGALNGTSHTFTQSLGERTYRNQTVPVEDDDGTITHGIALAQNVTDQVERKQELKAQNERLEEFASVISHDLRNPLQVATGRLELAQAECDSVHLDDIADALDRSQALIDDLLTLTQDSGTITSTEAVSISAQAEECWQMIPSDEATLVINGDGTISADRSRLRQLLENLFANAVEHAGQGVTISVGRLADGFYIADDGGGIPESEHENIFEAGYSTADDGTGFGLRIVKQIVDDHDWEVTVTDSNDGGTRFEITGVDTTG